MDSVKLPLTKIKRSKDSYSCGIEATVDLMTGKWKPLILFQLHEVGTQRFSELRRIIPGVTEKMLIAQLRDLAADGLIQRTVYAVVPPKVEYQLTPLGRSMSPLLEAMRIWGDQYLLHDQPGEKDAP